MKQSPGHIAATIIRRALKSVAWMLAGIACICILALFVLQFSWVQRYIAQQAVRSISEKTHTRIEVGSVNILTPQSIVLQNIFVESLHRDTLLSLRYLAADVNLLDLFSRRITLRFLEVDSLTAHITRTLPDSSFNFDFLLNALASGSPAEAGPDTSSGPGWEFQLQGLNLNGIHLTYVDEVDGMDLTLDLGALETMFDVWRLDNNQFSVDKLSLTNTAVSVRQTKHAKPDGSPSAAVDLGFGSIALANIHIMYDAAAQQSRYSVHLGTSTLVAEKIDFLRHRIALKTFQLENTQIAVLQPGTKPDSPSHSADAVLPWAFSLEQLLLHGVTAQYDVQGASRVSGVDPNHLRIADLAMRAENISLGENLISADIGHVSFHEKSGLELRELSGRISVDSIHARVADFILETGSSRVRQNLLLRYPSVSALTQDPGSVDVELAVSDSYLDVSDLLLFQPSLATTVNRGATLRFSMRLSGLVRNLRIAECKVQAGDSTTAELTGAIRGLPELRTANYDLHLSHFSSGRTDIRALVADAVLPRTLVLPAALRMSGDFAGTLDNFSAASVIATSIGRLEGDVALTTDERSGSKESRWKVDLTADEFDVGALLHEPESFGPVSLRATGTGTGLRREDIQATLKVTVDRAVLNGYSYEHFTLEGTASPTMFEGKAAINDSNIAFTFNGTVNIGEAHTRYAFLFDLKGADLQRLHLSADDIRVTGVITSDLTGQNINDMNGRIDVRNVVIIKNRKRYQIDSLLYATVNKEHQTHISVESPFFSAAFDGSIAPGELTTALQEHLGRYFTLHDSLPSGASAAQAFTFRLELRDPRIVTEVLFPQLERLTGAVIEGSYDSEKMNLNVKADCATAAYAEFDADSLSLRITSDPHRLESTLRAGTLGDSMVSLTNVQLSARVEHDSIDMALSSMGGNGETKMLLAGIWNRVSNGYRFHIRPEGIVFRNTPWSVPADNYLIVGSDRFVAHDVVFTDGTQRLSLRTVDGAATQLPLHIDFTEFDLATMSRVIERDSGLVGGVLNGNVVLSSLFDHMAFTSNLTVKDFAFVRKIVGNIVVDANNRTANVYDIRMGITGNDNDIAVHGEYRSMDAASELALDLDVKKMNLASIEPFAFGSVQHLSGRMSGELHVNGTTKKPSITGHLQFANAAFVPALLGSPLRLPQGRIDFDGQGIHFRSFELLDTLGNKASVSGTLVTRDYRDFSFDCRLHTDHFLLVNKPASRNALYYGTIYFDSDVIVSGDLSKPIVRMESRLDKGTDLALVLPESEADVQQRAGIVRFMDVQHPANPILSRRSPGTETQRDTTRGRPSSLELTANVEVDKEARLRILIDPIAGDSLVIRGAAMFSVVADASGKLAVTGRYDIQEGSYQLSFGELIRREFAIQQGSSLTWFGSVTEASVDITAIYTAKTSAFDLVQDQLTGLSQEERNKYKQELRVQVYLMITGNLLEPGIRFRLDLPPDQKGVLGGSVYAKLNELNGQESELYKQVFALLVLGRFISSNPLASASDAGGLSGFARSSVSQILTEQLNRLSEQVITGVKLNVGVESYQDYSSGSAEGRTQLQLALSKQLFDERLTVQVGGNVDLEGQRSQHNSLNNFAGDIKVAYKMTEDGRWQLLVFRNNTYSGAIEGDLVETGVGLMFTIDYDKLFGITLTPARDDKEDR